MFSRLSTREPGRYLLRGGFKSQRRLRAQKAGQWRVSLEDNRELKRDYSSSTTVTEGVPLRKQLKDNAKKAKKGGKKSKVGSQSLDCWQLTVGIEIHAQLNTAQKLFSPAITSFNDDPNSHAAPFDVALPGSQPVFQKEAIIPALRAALALNCDVQTLSRFDRKHYFWWDQPSGYQITQFYEPFARDGHIKLLARDGIAPEDGDEITIGIKQVQLEQDTAKTLAQDQNVQWLDFNRVGVPLIEIITEPEIHHPRTAAAFVKKVQLLLSTVDACVSGMETGGLRADVNVSVRSATDGTGTPLGTRTEIKNLSTIKAVENAIIAERDRQITVIEGGGQVLGETRGWTVGSNETRRLRGKEGEVDYRYMPDPDVPPLLLGAGLVEQLRDSLPTLPDAELDHLVSAHGLTSKDALSLVNLDNGLRILYFYRVLARFEEMVEADAVVTRVNSTSHHFLISNWVLHELGRLTTRKAGSSALEELNFTRHGECQQVPAEELAQLLYHLYRKQITGKVAKELLLSLSLGDLEDGVRAAIEANDLWFHEISLAEYSGLAEEVIRGEERTVKELTEADHFPQGKLMYLVGKMMRLGPAESIDPVTAERILRSTIEGQKLH